MQRNNAKDDAVEGGENGERPPSSQPIAPAAGLSPPQPAGKSIPKSPRRGAGILKGVGGRWRWRVEWATISCDATGHRVYGERDGMKKRGRRAAWSGAEEVVEGHFGLDDAGMGVFEDTLRCNKRQMNCASCLRDSAERLTLANESLFSFGVDHVFVRNVFHLADVNDPVRTVKQQVNL